MAEIKDIKERLIQQARDGELTPSDAFAAFDKISPTQLKTGRIYEKKSIEERKAQYESARRVRSSIREARVPFVNPSFLPDFYLAQGLVVVGAESGRAKSTTCSNVLHGFLQSSGKNAIVISNEESTDAVYERAACIATRTDYTSFYRNGANAGPVTRYVTDRIIPRVEVIEDGAYDMSYLEDVQAVLESAPHDNVGIVLIDYLQVITQSRQNPDWAAFQVSKALGLYLKEYGKKHGIPVVCFAQLHPESRGPTMSERIQNDKTFFNHGFACIEIKPDFETLTTTFKIHKDRFFGHTGKEVVAKFEGGRYEFSGGDL